MTWIDVIEIVFSIKRYYILLKNTIVIFEIKMGEMILSIS